MERKKSWKAEEYIKKINGMSKWLILITGEFSFFATFSELKFIRLLFVLCYYIPGRIFPGFAVAM